MLNHFFDYKPEVLALDEKALELCQPYFKQMEDSRAISFERLARDSLTQTEKRNCSSQNYCDTVLYPKVLFRMIIRVCYRNFLHQVPDLGFSQPIRRYSAL